MIWFILMMLWQADPDQARFEQARQLAAEGRCMEAAPVFRQLAAAHPHSARFRSRRAVRIQREGLPGGGGLV